MIYCAIVVVANDPEASPVQILGAAEHMLWQVRLRELSLTEVVGAACTEAVPDCGVLSVMQALLALSIVALDETPKQAAGALLQGLLQVKDEAGVTPVTSTVVDPCAWAFQYVSVGESVLEEVQPKLIVVA